MNEFCSQSRHILQEIFSRATVLYEPVITVLEENVASDVQCGGGSGIRDAERVGCCAGFDSREMNVPESLQKLLGVESATVEGACARPGLAMSQVCWHTLFTDVTNYLAPIVMI
jgi:hypothetical protein